MAIQYKSVRIREKTYKELKILAIKLDISMLELIQRLYDSRNEGSLTSPT